MAVLAEDAKLYYSPTDDWSGSDWTEICNVMDVSLSMSVSEVEVTRRCSGGYREFLQGLVDASVEFGMLFEIGDAGYTALRTAFDLKDTIIVYIASGNISESGTYEGLKMEALVSNFSRDESLGDALKVSVTLRPASNAAGNVPTWLVTTTP